MTANTYLEIHPSTTVPVAEAMQVDVISQSDTSFKISSFTTPTIENTQILSSKISETQKSSAGEYQSKVSFQLMPLSPGTIQFPSLHLYLSRQNNEVQDLITPQVSIAVINPIESTTPPPELRDIKGPVSAGTNPLIWLVLFAAVLLLGTLWWYAKKRVKVLAPQAPQEPPRPPHEIAIENLNLAYQNYKKNLDARIFYWNVSLTFREYLHGRYSIDALEATTSEIYGDLRAKDLELKICARAREILASCDLVKFAKLIPSENQLEDDFVKTKDFIELTKV